MYDEDSDGLISRAILKVIGPKKRWRAYKARVRALPENYRTAVEAIERYLMHFGAMDAGSAESLFEDVADLFERAAADGTPIRDIVGDDPVEFVEALIANYDKGGYVARERNRLSRAIARAAGEAHAIGEAGATGEGKGTV
jgi:DNA-binding ferritin-like protein (Dps family)